MTINMILEQIVFYAAAVTIVFAGIMVIGSRNPVRGALFLVLAFVASAILWILLEAEFLALALIFVYVGAVMTLFLFVVMMLDINLEPMKTRFVRYLPLGLLVMALVLVLVIFAVAPQHFGTAKYAVPQHASASYSNVKELGSVLYTTYMYPFELASVLLLVAIIAAISLALPSSRKRRLQRPGEQVQVKREDRLRMVKMQAEKKILPSRKWLKKR